MKNILFTFLIIGLYLTTACNVLINPTKSDISISQNETVIHNVVGSYDFGSILLHSTKKITFKIHNNGIHVLTLEGEPLIEVNGIDVSDFTVDTGMTDVEIQSTEETEFTITFIPNSVGTKSAEVSIESNDPDENPYIFKLIGTCTDPLPEINVKQTGNNILCNSGIYDFGLVAVGKQSQNITFVIENIGPGLLELSSNPEKIKTIGADSSMFIVDQANVPNELKAGESTEFNISFNPSSPGTRTIKVSILNSDNDENPYIFTLVGTGYPVPEIIVKQGSDILVNGSGEYDFGKVKLDSVSSEVTFTIENVGTSVLQLTGNTKLIEKSGTDKDSFIINDSNTSQFIQPGNSTTFTIKFVSQNEGTNSVTISIKNNDSNDSPYTFEVTAFVSIYDWTRIFYSNDYLHPKVVKTDSNNNVYICGYFKQSVNFGADFGVSDIKTSSGNNSSFLTKINANKTYAWTRIYCGSDYIDPSDLAIDSNDNVYIIGTFNEDVNFGVDFGVNDTKHASNSVAISFLTKINSNNTYGGTKIFGGSRYIVSYEIEIASSGNIYISGNFGNTVDFGADFGVSDVKTGTGINQSGTFIVKLNANGTYGWAKMISGTSIVNSYSISVDSSECIIVSGIFRGTIDFGSDFGVTDIKTSTGATNDTFITKFNSNRYLWTKTIGGTTEAYGGEVAVSDDKIFVTGYFSGSIDFGHDFGVNDIKTAIGYEELYITRIEANGNYCWTKVFSNADKKRLYNAVINNSRYVYIVGIFNGTLDFGKDFGTTDIKTSKGSGNWELGDVFITKITVNGSYEWTKRIGGTGDDLAFSIDLDSKSNVYTYGFYDSTVDFGEDFGATDIKNLSTTYNLFLTKLLQ